MLEDAVRWCLVERVRCGDQDFRIRFTGCNDDRAYGPLGYLATQYPKNLALSKTQEATVRLFASCDPQSPRPDSGLFDMARLMTVLGDKIPLWMVFQKLWSTSNFW